MRLFWYESGRDDEVYGRTTFAPDEYLIDYLEGRMAAKVGERRVFAARSRARA